jgi:hypothetical protein
MNRRQAVTAIGTGGLAFAASAAAADPAAVFKVSAALPEQCDLDGKLTIRPTLRNAGYGFRFVVAVENVSAADVYVWAESNSEGHGALSFEVIVGGKKVVVRRNVPDPSKNVLRLERLAPGAVHARVVEYDTLPEKPPQWEAFPFGPKESRMEVTLRAVFEQRKVDWKGKVTPWDGRVVSPEYKIVLMNA